MFKEIRKEIENMRKEHIELKKKEINFWRRKKYYYTYKIDWTAQKDKQMKT